MELVLLPLNLNFVELALLNETVPLSLGLLKFSLEALKLDEPLLNVAVSEL